MKHLESHALPLTSAVLTSAGHIGIAVNHTGGTDSAAFANLSVIGVEDILHGIAGAGRTGKITTPASDAACGIFIPERIFQYFKRNVLRDCHMYFIFGNKTRRNVLLRFTCRCKNTFNTVLGHIRIIHSVDAVNRKEITVIHLIAFHVDTETVFKGALAADEGKMNQISAAAVEPVLFLTICKINLIQTFYSVHIAAAQENQNLLFVQICLLDLLLCKKEQCLG